ncbi:TetR/AcrR family transcriptional regulator [bacterium]|jgi:TetR/AcrR family transcriptional regulator, regulator of autoinduction and epiphytic fitness|nr:TetR/AcrR family transcriptional regulator [bacterium]
MAQSEDKKSQILKAATSEFLAKGLDASSMHRIAELAQVSKRTLYKYYPNKDSLYAALIDELLNKVCGLPELEFVKDVPIKKQLETIVENKIELFMSPLFLEMSKIVLGEMMKSRRPTDEQLLRMSLTESGLANWVEAGKKAGVITSTLTSEKIVGQFHSILKGQVFYPVLFYFSDTKLIDTEDVKRTTVDFFLNLFCR